MHASRSAFRTCTPEAQDSLGASATTSIQISATALPNIPPTTSVVNPVDGDAYLTPQTIVISANAADSDGSIASVEFYQNNNLIGTVGSSPYSLSWTIPSMGSFQLATRAIDDVGDAVYSTPVNIVVGNNLNIYKLGKHVRPDLCLEDGLGILENIGRLDDRASG